ncbi:RRM3, partial [Symbiodinium sp. CCMP2456]
MAPCPFSRTLKRRSLRKASARHTATVTITPRSMALVELCLTSLTAKGRRRYKVKFRSMTGQIMAFRYDPASSVLYRMGSDGVLHVIPLQFPVGGFRGGGGRGKEDDSVHAIPDGFRLIKMPGDGNCLFHALSHDDDGDGAALREEVRDFLEEQAANQEEFEESWLEEAELLDEDPATAWGGDASILAWTLMREQRAVLHWCDEQGQLQVTDKTHWQ